MKLYDAKVIECVCPQCGCICYAIVPNELEKYQGWIQHVELPVCDLELNADVWMTVYSLIKKDAHEKIIEQGVKRMLNVKA
jgi:hypothetical protein